MKKISKKYFLVAVIAILSLTSASLIPVNFVPKGNFAGMINGVPSQNFATGTVTVNCLNLGGICCSSGGAGIWYGAEAPAVPGDTQAYSPTIYFTTN
jgi:hypothetical protein